MSTPSKPTPLQALADATASKREIRRLLTKWAADEVDSVIFLHGKPAKARAELRRRLRLRLDARGFANFGRKKMLDQVVARAMRRGWYFYNA